jgi:hypothetical protein
MLAVWISDRELIDESGAQVLVEQKLHSAARRPEMPFTSFTGRSESQRGADVLGLQAREVSENLFLGHATGEVLEDIVDGDPSALDTGLPAPDSGGDTDVILEPHGLNVRPLVAGCKSGWFAEELHDRGLSGSRIRSSSNSAFASLRSAVSKPSVNQP